MPLRHRVLLAEGQQLLERSLCLLKLAALAAAFEETADAVVVPPLPRGLDRRRLRYHELAVERQTHLVLAHVHDRQLRRLFPTVNELHVLVIELPIPHAGGEFDRPGRGCRNVEPVVNDRRRAWWYLFVVERCEDVLRVAAVDAVAVAVEHEDVDEVRPRIDRPGIIRVRSGAVASDLHTARGGTEVHPDLVRVPRALREMVAQAERAHHHFDDVGPWPRSSGGSSGRSCTSPPTSRFPGFNPKMSMRTFLSLPSAAVPFK